MSTAVGDQRHHVAVERLALLQCFRGRAVFRQMIEPIFELGDLGPKAAILIN